MGERVHCVASADAGCERGGGRGFVLQNAGLFSVFCSAGARRMDARNGTRRKHSRARTPTPRSKQATVSCRHTAVTYLDCAPRLRRTVVPKTLTRKNSDSCVCPLRIDLNNDKKINLLVVK